VRGTVKAKEEPIYQRNQHLRNAKLAATSNLIGKRPFEALPKAEFLKMSPQKPRHAKLGDVFATERFFNVGTGNLIASARI